MYTERALILSFREKTTSCEDKFTAVFYGKKPGKRRQFQTDRVLKAENLWNTASIKIVLISRSAPEFQVEVIRSL